MLTTLMLLMSTAFAGSDSSEHVSLQLGLVYAMPAALTALSSDQAFVAAEAGIASGYGRRKKVEEHFEAKKVKELLIISK